MKPRAFFRDAYLRFASAFTKPSAVTHFLNGHFVFPYEEVVDIQKEVFYTQLKAISSFCKLVGPDEALSELHQTSHPLICLTFDDGFKDVATILVPVLDALNLKAIFFVNPAYLGLRGKESESVLRSRYITEMKKEFLTTKEVYEIAQKGHVIGSHTLTHRRLNTLDRSILNDEILSSKFKIEQITKKPCDHFAYPFGGLNDFSGVALEVASACYPYIFSSIKNGGCFSFDRRVINRRHFEGYWDVGHVKYFLSGRS